MGTGIADRGAISAGVVSGGVRVAAAIHGAQSASVRQMDARGCGDDELLRITCGKGGTSVLADAYLARGELTAEEAEFGFTWGVLLQLGDDLQDVGEDLERGSETLFTRAVRAG